MFDIYKRTFSMLLWGISLVNIVKLTSSKSQGMSDSVYFILITILILVLIILFLKKRTFLKPCRPNIVAVISILILVYIMIKDIMIEKVIVNYILLTFTLVSMIILIISTFYELQD